MTMTYAKYKYLKHHGVEGQVHGVRQYQYDDGSLTPLGREHYGVGPPREPGKEEKKEARRLAKIDKLINSGNSKKILKKQKTLTAEQLKTAMAKAKEVDEYKKQQGHKPSLFERRALEKKARKEKAEKEEAEKKAKEEAEKKAKEEKERQDILKSGDAALLLKNQSRFSAEELQKALSRVRQNRTIREEADRDAFNADAEVKRKILLSGDAQKILDNQDRFTPEEIDLALTRIRQNRVVRNEAEIDRVEKLRSEDKIGQSLDKWSARADNLLKAASVVEKIAGAKNRIRDVFADKEINEMSVEDALNNASNFSMAKLKVLANRLEAFNSVNKARQTLLNNTRTNDIDINDVFKNPSKYSNNELDTLLNKYEKVGGISKAINAMKNGGNSDGGQKGRFNIRAMSPQEIAANLRFMNPDEQKEAVSMLGIYKTAGDTMKTFGNDKFNATAPPDVHKIIESIISDPDFKNITGSGTNSNSGSNTNTNSNSGSNTNTNTNTNSNSNSGSNTNSGSNINSSSDSKKNRKSFFGRNKGNSKESNNSSSDTNTIDNNTFDRAMNRQIGDIDDEETKKIDKYIYNFL